MSEELKPCPFCGGEAEFRYTEYDPKTDTGDDGMGWAMCLNMECGARFFDDRESAIEKWNRRAPPAKRWEKKWGSPVSVSRAASKSGPADTEHELKVRRACEILQEHYRATLQAPAEAKRPVTTVEAIRAVKDLADLATGVLNASSSRLPGVVERNLKEAESYIEQAAQDHKDAERYRWLREHSFVPRGSEEIHFGPGYQQNAPEFLDQAVDKSRQQSEGQQ